MGEDAFTTSENAMAVGDGVGGSSFISYYLASTLAMQTVNFFQTVADSKDVPTASPKSKLFPELVSGLSKSIDDFRTKFSDAYNNIKKEFEDKEIVDLETALRISSTLIACQIHETDANANNFHIIQRGDSLIAVFRPKPSRATPGSFFYYPIFVSEEHQYEFNFPYQFGTATELDNETDNLFMSLKAQEGDIVIIGSDGLFDNVHIGYLTYLVNEIADYINDGIQKIEDVKNLIKESVNKYGSAFEPSLHKERRRMMKKQQPIDRTKPMPKKHAIKKKNTGSSNRRGFGLFSLIAYCFGEEEEPVPEPPVIEKMEEEEETRYVPNSEDLEEENEDFDDSKETVDFKNVIDFFSCSSEALSKEPINPDQLTPKNSLRDDKFWESLAQQKSSEPIPEVVPIITEEDLCAKIQPEEDSGAKIQPEDNDDDFGELSTSFMTKCARRGIEKNFSFSSEDLKLIAKRFDAKKFAEVLVYATELLSKKAKYPSPFYIHANMSRQFVGKHGKQDDITVVAGLVISLDKESIKESQPFDWKTEITKRETKDNDELEKDIKSFVKNYSDEDFTPLYRPVEKIQQQILI